MEFVVNGKTFTNLSEAQAYEAELQKQAEIKKKEKEMNDAYKAVISKLNNIVVAALHFNKDMYSSDVDEMVYLVIKSSQDIPSGKLIEGYAEAIFGNQFSVDDEGVHICFDIIPLTKDIDVFKTTIAKYVVEHGITSCKHQAERIEIKDGECICFVDADCVLHEGGNSTHHCNASDCKCDCESELDCERIVDTLAGNIARIITTSVFGV